MASHIARAFKAAITLLASAGQYHDDTPTVGDSTSFQIQDVNASPYKPTIEVLPPPYRNVRGDACVVPLGVHEFGYSYGTPFVNQFAPVACDPSHSVVYLRWEASTPLGIQFDRIAAVWVNGVELLRTSTEQPDRKSGVTWEVVKDVSNYYDVVRGGGTVVVALDNIIDGPYNSSFTITLSAEFYKPLDLEHSPRRPDIVVPVSKSNSTYGWFFVEPSSVATGGNSAQVSVPPNTEELYVELFLSHHQCDEFWFTNPPNAFADDNGWCGNGPFREVQVLVDGEITGVVWPFPLFFSGGMNPYLWRPIVAIGAFQVPTYIVNLTPFLGKFVDSKPHNVTFFVDYGIDFWPIDGNLLVYVDKEGTQTMAEVLSKKLDEHVVPVTAQQVDGINANFTLFAKRSLEVTSSVTTSKGTKIYHLDQQFKYANAQEYSQDGEVGTFNTHTTVKTKLTVTTTGGSTTTLDSEEEYPLWGKTFYRTLPESRFRLEADIANGFRRDLRIAGDGNFRFDYWPKDVTVSLTGTAAMESGIGGNGTTKAAYTERFPSGVCFTRIASADGGVLLQDESSDKCLRP